MVTCSICGHQGLDITQHLKLDHQMSVDQYKDLYHTIVVDPSIELKRKETCKELYGNPNYKNEEAQKLANEVFEGGHSLRDPAVREKGCETKQALYGDPNFTNREQAKETIMEKYGVENIAHIPGVQEKKVDTLMKRYGKIFNWDRPDAISKEDLIRMHHVEKLSLVEIGKKLGYTPEGIGYWMRKHGIEVHKKIVVPHRDHKDNRLFVKCYLEHCLEKGQILTFYEYGNLTEKRRNDALKRLFHTGSPYHHLRDELSNVALHPELWDGFLAKIKSH
jgi:hypothetical protein